MFTIESRDAQGRVIVSFPVHKAIAANMFHSYAQCAVQHQDGRSIVLKHDDQVLLAVFAD